MEQSIAQFQANEHNNFIQGQFAELEAEHPDWNDIAESPEFRRWITQQPGSTKQCTKVIWQLMPFISFVATK